MQQPTSEGEPAAVQASTAEAVDRQPFLTLPTFRMLALASPVLESFFERDLPASFQLTSPTPASSSSNVSDALVSEAPIAAAQVVPPARRGLGSLFGLVSAPTSQPTKEVRSRPRPSFGVAARTLDGRPLDTDTLRQDAEAARLRTSSSSGGGGDTSRPTSRPRTPVINPPTPTLPSSVAETKGEGSTAKQELDVPPRPSTSKRLSLRGTDMIGTGSGSAKASLAAATAALLSSPVEEHDGLSLALLGGAEGGFREDKPAPEEEDEEEMELERKEKEDEDRALARALKRLSTALEVGSAPKGGELASPPVKQIDLALLEQGEEL